MDIHTLRFRNCRDFPKPSKDSNVQYVKKKKKYKNVTVLPSIFGEEILQIAATYAAG